MLGIKLIHELFMTEVAEQKAAGNWYSSMKQTNNTIHRTVG